MHASPFFLKTMGSPGLFDPVGEPVRFRVRKHLALVVYLATEGAGVHRRDFLADLLWPSARTVNEGRHSLATGLSVIRAKLGPNTVVAARDTVQLALEVLSVDIWHLQAGQSSPDKQFSAIELDAFLDPFELQDAEPFMRWRERMQARLLPAITASIDERIGGSRRRGNAREMEQLADRLLALDPLNEQGIRAKMEACAFAGDRVAALRLFERWKTQLAQELNALPSDATERIAARLRIRAWDRPSEVAISTAATEQWRDRTFIGREREYQLLYDGWERTCARRPQHALISGEPGIGKTTLAERLTTAAALSGATVARVKCYEADRSTPYSVLSFAVAQLLRLPGASATSPAALSTLARIAPAIRDRFPSVPEPYPTQGESARVHLAEAFHQLASAVADENPLIVVLDDIHLADDATLAALHLAIRRTSDQRIMYLLTLRQDQMDQVPHIAELYDLAGALGSAQFDLAPLKEAEARELVYRLLSSCERKITAAGQKAILAAGAGHPMALELLVDDWREHGDDALALCVPAMTRELPIRKLLSDTPQHQRLLERLTLTLDDVTQRVLSVAALLGRRLNDLEFYNLVDLSTGETLTGLMRLKRLKVLRDGGDELEFANELLRARVYKEVPSPIRRVLHSRIADRLIDAATNRQHDLEIAWHCIRAGRFEEAVVHLLDGAEQAAQSGAPHEAERALVTALPQLTGVQQQRGALLLAEVQQEQGRWHDSLLTLDEHQQSFTLNRTAEAEVLRLQASLRASAAVDAHALSHLAILRALMSDQADVALGIRAASVAAYICANTRDAQAARTCLDLASTLSQRAGDAYQVLSIATTCALLAYHAGDKTTSSEHLLAAKHAVEANRIANSVAVRVYVGLGTLAAARGDYIEALRHSEAALALATRLGRDDSRRICLANAALCHERLGNVAEQVRCASEELQGMEGRVAEYEDIHAGAIKAAAHAISGQEQECRDTLLLVDQRLSRDTPPWIITAWKLMKADVLMMVGREPEARDCARSAVRFDTPGDILGHFEGKIAAWTVSLAESPSELLLASNRIEPLLARLEDFDLLDQADVLAASVVMAVKAGKPFGDLLMKLEERLARLPPPCAALLVDLRLTRELRAALAQSVGMSSVAELGNDHALYQWSGQNVNQDRIKPQRPSNPTKVSD